MWVWHRKMRDTNGLLLIKQGGIFEDVPSNWRDHIPVVRGDRKKTLPLSIQSGNQEDLFESLTSKSIRVELDSEHRRHIDWLNEHGAAWHWDADRNMLVTHTWFLHRLHEDLDLKGIFKQFHKVQNEELTTIVFVFL